MERAIGRYRVRRLIGTGGMAEVYEVEGTGPAGFRKKLCLKKIRKEFADFPDFIRSFEAEARIAAGLHHPNIVEVLDFARTEKGELYLVMELIDGLNLKAILDEAGEMGLRLPLDFAVHVLQGLLFALDHAHSQEMNGEIAPIVHRDVSPHNILISTEGQVKLADFGIAKAKGVSDVTRTGFIKGKPSYMSPEQASRGSTVGPATDLFAAGVVFWEMVTGARLFQGDSDSARLLQVASFKKASLPRPEFSAELDRFLSGLLTADLTERYRSAEVALSELEKLGIKPCSRIEAAKTIRKLTLHLERAEAFEKGRFPTVRSLLTPNSNGRIDPLPTRKIRVITPVRIAWISAALTVVALAAATVIKFAYRTEPVPQAIPAAATATKDAKPAAVPAPPGKPAPNTAIVSILPELPQTASVETTDKPKPTPPAASPTKPKKSSRDKDNKKETTAIENDTENHGKLTLEELRKRKVVFKPLDE